MSSILRGLRAFLRLFSSKHNNRPAPSYTRSIPTSNASTLRHSSSSPLNHASYTNTHYPSSPLNHFSNTNTPIQFTLMAFKKNQAQYVDPDLDIDRMRKNLAMRVVESIRSRTARNIQGGSLALDRIRVMDYGTVIVPQDSYNPAVHKNYVEGFKDFFEDYFGGCEEPLHDEYYLHIKSYVENLTTIDEVVRLLFHPYFQTESEFLSFIPDAMKVLERLRGKKFPPPKTGVSHANPDLATDDQFKAKNWQHTYSALVVDEVNISDSISKVTSKDLRDALESIYDAGKNGKEYKNNSAIDELIFFKNVCHRLKDNMKEKLRFERDVYPAMRQVLPKVPLTMYRFFWIYEGYHGLTLEFVRVLGVVFKKKNRIN